MPSLIRLLNEEEEAGLHEKADLGRRGRQPASHPLLEEGVRAQRGVLPPVREQEEEHGEEECGGKKESGLPEETHLPGF